MCVCVCVFVCVCLCVCESLCVIEDSIFSLLQPAQIYTEPKFVRAPPRPKPILNATADQPITNSDKSEDSDAKAIDNLMADLLGVTLAVAFMV